MSHAATSDRCAWCGSTSGYVWVTSHTQCTVCGQVVESCCEGFACGDERPGDPIRSDGPRATPAAHADA